MLQRRRSCPSAQACVCSPAVLGRSGDTESCWISSGKHPQSANPPGAFWASWHVAGPAYGSPSSRRPRVHYYERVAYQSPCAVDRTPHGLSCQGRSRIRRKHKRRDSQVALDPPPRGLFIAAVGSLSCAKARGHSGQKPEYPAPQVPHPGLRGHAGRVSTISALRNGTLIGPLGSANAPTAHRISAQDWRPAEAGLGGVTYPGSPDRKSVV